MSAPLVILSPTEISMGYSRDLRYERASFAKQLWLWQPQVEPVLMLKVVADVVDARTMHAGTISLCI